MQPIVGTVPSSLPSVPLMRIFSLRIDHLLIPILSSTTGTAFPPLGSQTPKFCYGFPQLPVLCDPLISAGSLVFVFRPTTYRFRGAQQISLGNARRFCNYLVASTRVAPTNIGLRRWRPTYPPRTPHGASLSLETVTHLRLLPNTPSRASVHC
jgi:hypothetical protein